ncbi:MAG: GAF domain-containing protein, partial [bacterium]
MSASERESGVLNPPAAAPEADLSAAYGALASAALKILQEKELSQVLQTICEEACRVLGAERSLIQQESADASGGYDTSVLCVHKIPPDFVEALLRRRTPSILTDVLKQSEVEVIEDTSQDARAFDPKAVRKAGHRTACFIPLNAGEAPFRALVLYHLSPREYSARDRELARAFGELAALAIENARLVGALETRIGEQESLGRALRHVTSERGAEEIVQAVLAESGRVMGTDRCSVMLPDAETGEPRQFVSQGISTEFNERLAALPEPFPVGMAYLSNPGREAPEIIPDATTDPAFGPIQAGEGHRTIAAFPLRARGRNIGVLFYFWTSLEEIGADRIALGQAFASQVAVALDRARSVAEAERRAAHLSIAGEIAKAVGST